MKERDLQAIRRIREHSSRFVKRPIQKVPPAIAPLAASLRADAEKGDAAAMTSLAYLYSEFQLGTPGEGWRLYKRAMAMGEPAAHCAVGMGLFQQGRRKQGLRLMETAAKYGVTEAQVRLAYIYMYGEGIKKNFVRAEQLLKRAWTKGNPDAAFWLGVKREWVDRGRLRYAVSWYERAARRGVPSAMVSYARALEAGGGVRRDPKAALRWYHKAASLGDTEGAVGARRLRGIKNSKVVARS